MRSSNLLAIVMPITIVRGLISGLQSSLQVMMLRWNLSPRELSTMTLQYHVIFSILAWSLLIIFLLSLYFLYRTTTLMKDYKKVLVELIAASFLGLFLGGAAGHIISGFYMEEPPHVLTVIFEGLSACTHFLIYSFGGFTVIALSYFRTCQAT